MSIDSECVGELRVAAIQGDIETAEKWYANPQETLDKHKEIADTAAQEANIVVWPETAIPFAVNNEEYLTNYLIDEVKQNQTAMIVGCYHKNNNDFHNATRYISSNGEFLDTVYYKQQLVPFGEYMPLKKILSALLPKLTQLSLFADEITRGTESTIFDTEYGKIGSLICFDSIYESLAIESVKNGAQLLVISTNDCWFKDSIALQQHNAHAVLRSIETGRYVIRAANTGISSIISDKGCTIEQLKSGDGYICATVKLKNESTLYSQVGNVWYLFILLILLLIFNEKNIIRLMLFV